MQSISAYILTYNEAEKLQAAVESVLWADEIVVVDSCSTDATAEIATALGARVVQVPFNGFGDLRNRAIEACRCDWIFSLDADERCTAEVRDEILELLAGAPPFDVYRVPRRSFMMGRWIQGCGWTGRPSRRGCSGRPERRSPRRCRSTASTRSSSIRPAPWSARRPSR